MRIRRSNPMTGRAWRWMTWGEDPGPMTDLQLLHNGIETGCWDDHGQPCPWPQPMTIGDYLAECEHHQHELDNQPPLQEHNPDSQPPF